MAFVLSAISWYIFAKWRCHQKHKKLSAQKLVSFGTKKIGKI
jgi:hypothetical protein